jgi:cell shape-determining protein MreC
MYSKHFIERVKEVYPDYPYIHLLADEGSLLLGRILYDWSSNNISVDEVLSATSLKRLQKRAIELKTRKELYRDWLEETQSSEIEHMED